MAQSYITDAGALIIPGAYSQITVQSAPSGITTTGVLMIVAEADAGPDYSLEESLNDNAFGPDQAADVISKYKSGPLVDAFKSAVAAANDPNILGSFNRAILVKSNPSTKASSTLLNYSAADYATLQDRSYGKLGNLISSVVTAEQDEVAPTTGAFLLLPPISSVNINVRVNGGAAQALTLTAAELPSAMVSALDGLTDVDATGGVNRGLLGTVTGTIALAAISGMNVTVTRSISWSAPPVVGDIFYIPTTSPLATTQTTNAGSYVVTAVGAANLSATKLHNAAGSQTVTTAPVTQSAVSVAATSDVAAFSPVTISVSASDPLDGVGKSLEINELTTGTHLLSYLCFSYDTTNGAVASTWVSTAAAPKVINSAAEYIPTLTISRQLDGVTEDISAGGAVALKIGYAGTSASLVNNGTTVTITVVGGAGTSPAAITLADHPTISDLAAYINSLTGFTAAPGTTVIGSQPSTSLDQGTFTIGSTHGSYTGRIKQDAYKFFNTVATDSALAELDAQATAGLPAPQSLAFLAGGTKGATTDAIFDAAVDALELCRGNFLIPCFSRDASSDVADGLTDASSTYTIANIHAYSRAHALKMSTMKRKRNRQAFLSTRTTFANAQNVAGNIASFRCSMTFQDVKDTGANGIVQFQPWMAAVKAAAIQAAGFYRPIVRKGIAISGALQAAGDFNDQNDSQMENALLAGLLPIRQDETGGFYWVSDQTTYGADSNFFRNSIQAVYVADVLALTVQQRMERAFVGQSLADVTASMGLSTLEGIMEDMRRLKLIAASDDAPKGFKNATIRITNGAMVVAFEAKLAGALYFIPINVAISQVSQSA